MAVTAGSPPAGTVAGVGWRAACRAGPRNARLNLDKYREARQVGISADAARIRRELGHEPRVSLAEGMAEAEGHFCAKRWLKITIQELSNHSCRDIFSNFRGGGFRVRLCVCGPNGTGKSTPVASAGRGESADGGRVFRPRAAAWVLWSRSCPGKPWTRPC